MIILDEKMPAPPPYSPRNGAAPPSFPPPFPSNDRAGPILSTLPPHLLLRIVYSTFTDAMSIERQRKTLYWFTISLRLVNRAFYIGEYHIPSTP